MKGKKEVPQSGKSEKYCLLSCSFRGFTMPVSIAKAGESCKKKTHPNQAKTYSLFFKKSYFASLFEHRLAFPITPMNIPWKMLSEAFKALQIQGSTSHLGNLISGETPPHIHSTSAVYQLTHCSIYHRV